MKITASLFILIAGTTVLKAQKLPSFTHLADSVFENLNKSYITTGILYDRVYPSAMLHVFNSSYSDTSNIYHFSQAYYELYNAKYNRAGMTEPGLLDERIKQATTAGKVPIGVINFNFNQIDTNSLASNLLENRNGIFYDVPNRPRTPFLK